MAKKTAATMTAAQLKTLENRIAREYKKTYKELKTQWQNYISGYDEVIHGQFVHHKGLQERYDEQYQAYLDGKYTKEQFDAWYQNQIMRRDEYKLMADAAAYKATQANQIAAAYINDSTPSIAALNANYNSFLIAQKAPKSNFRVYNEQSIKNLLTKGENVTEFRTVSVNPIRDYNWNRSQIQSALTSAIMQGKSIEHLTDAFMVVMQKNRAAAVRNARTAYTSAQNCGVMQSMYDAKKMGINIKKQWYSMEDARVRHSHAKLDGEIQDIDKPFSNGLMYPGDAKGAPAEVYNCRCTMLDYLPDYDDVEPSQQDFDDWMDQQDQSAQLQQQIDDLELKITAKSDIIDDIKVKLAKKNKTYSGIWKDDVTLEDWAAKKGSISAKEQYFQDEIAKAQGVNAGKMVTMQAHLDDLHDFDKKGKSYDKLLQKKAAAEKDLKDLKGQQKALKIQLTGSAGYDPMDDPYSDERKNAALWAKDPKEADKVLRQKTGEVWRNATIAEKDAIYGYTVKYYPINEPLRGWEYGHSNYATGSGYKGVGNVDLNIGGKGKDINEMTKLIDRCSYDEDIWLQRGCGFGGMDKFLGVDDNWLRNATEADLQVLVGTHPTEWAFCSCGDAKGKGFDGDIIFNIYAPKGTNMMYLEPFSGYGAGAKRSWDGISTQSYFGQEAEVLLQQGTIFNITKVERVKVKDYWGQEKWQIYIDAEIIGVQPHQVWKKGP